MDGDCLFSSLAITATKSYLRTKICNFLPVCNIAHFLEKYFIGKYGRLESETCADVEILLWHDVVSNSISKHPYQATEPLSMHEFKEEVQIISGK